MDVWEINVSRTMRSSLKTWKSCGDSLGALKYVHDNKWHCRKIRIIMIHYYFKDHWMTWNGKLVIRLFGT